MKFIDLNKNLKEKIHNLYNITGSDGFLVKQAITNFKYALIKDFEEFDYYKADAEAIKADTSDFEAIPETFSGNKVSFIEDDDDLPF